LFSKYICIQRGRSVPVLANLVLLPRWL
jgi:hypothetical protein